MPRLYIFRPNRVPYVKIVRTAVNSKSSNLYELILIDENNNIIDPYMTKLIVGAKDKKQAKAFAERKIKNKKWLDKYYLDFIVKKSNKELLKMLRVPLLTP